MSAWGKANQAANYAMLTGRGFPTSWSNAPLASAARNRLLLIDLQKAIDQLLDMVGHQPTTFAPGGAH